MMMNPSTPSLYLELLKKTLIDYGNIHTYEYHPLSQVNATWKSAPLYPLDRLMRKRNFAICKLKYVAAEKRLNGYDWPAHADTMIGLNRLNNIEYCMRSIIQQQVPGDFIETGVWRGGATIFMRAVLKEFNITNRLVWVADSFQGLPLPNTKLYKADTGNQLHRLKILTVPLEEVKNNFKKYDLLDDQVRFLPGWFKDTLPQAPIKKLALIRLDGDMYESTYQAISSLYPKLSAGGFIIVDDYHAFDYCKQAILAYRKEHQITSPIIEIDKEAIYWQK
jgi:O-methyltransferase